MDFPLFNDPFKIIFISHTKIQKSNKWKDRVCESDLVALGSTLEE